MALRILTGLVNVSSGGPKTGNVTISFNPHQRSAGTVGVVERTTIGPAGRFTAVPGKVVALRQIKLIGVDPMSDYSFRLNDSISRDALTIRWRATGPAFTEEISYMVVGVVPDPITIEPILPRPGIRSRSRGRSRSKRSRKR